MFSVWPSHTVSQSHQLSRTPTTLTNDDIEAVIQMATSSRSSADGRSGPLKDTRTQLFVGNVRFFYLAPNWTHNLRFSCSFHTVYAGRTSRTFFAALEPSSEPMSPLGLTIDPVATAPSFSQRQRMQGEPSIFSMDILGRRGSSRSGLIVFHPILMLASHHPSPLLRHNPHPLCRHTQKSLIIQRSWTSITTSRGHLTTHVATFLLETCVYSE